MSYTDLRPDVERAVIELLAAELGTTVRGSFSEDDALPVVLVHLAGGGSVGWPHVLTAALVGLDVYADGKEEAWDLTAATLEYLTSLSGVAVGAPPYAWISAVDDAGSTLWIPDETTGRARYSAIVRVYARGESALT